MIVKNNKELEILREGGKKLAAVLSRVAKEAVPGVSTKFLDELAEKLILESGGKPSFKNYANPMGKKNYPATLCVSINEEVVHGIPDERTLKVGDVVGLDIGMWYEGLCTDTALTLIVGDDESNSSPSPRLSSGVAGQPPPLTVRGGGEERDNNLSLGGGVIRARHLVNSTKKSLELGISKVKAGVRVGDISFAIQSFLENEGFGVVRELVGHGVGNAVHEDPEIPNWGKPGMGQKLLENMVIAIEPMATDGSPKVKLLDDGWTWITRDGSRSAHFEHTLVVTKTGAEVLTKIS